MDVALPPQKDVKALAKKLGAMDGVSIIGVGPGSMMADIPKAETIKALRKELQEGWEIDKQRYIKMPNTRPGRNEPS